MGDLLSTPKSGGSSVCPPPGSGEAGSHRCFRLVPSRFVAPLKGAVTQTGGGDDAEGRGRAEAEVGWCSVGYGGRLGARGGHGLAGKWRRLGGQPCPCRRPGRGGAPSGLADAGECVSALSGRGCWESREWSRARETGPAGALVLRSPTEDVTQACPSRVPGPYRWESRFPFDNPGRLGAKLSVAVYSREQRASFLLSGSGDRSSPVFTDPSQHVRFFGRQLQYSLRKLLP